MTESHRHPSPPGHEAPSTGAHASHGDTAHSPASHAPADTVGKPHTPPPHTLAEHAPSGGSPGNHSAHAAHDGHSGHDKHAGHSPEAFRRKFWGSLLLTALVLAFDPHFLGLFGLSMPALAGARFVAPVLGTVLYGYGGWPFLDGAVREARARTPGMMMLIALGITVAFVYSLAVTFGLATGMALWWELATLVTVMVLGHWIEMASVQGASRALDGLAALVPATAHRFVGTRVEDVPVEALTEGDVLLVRPGEALPVDGDVVDGASSVNEAFLTGESRPVSKTAGDEVVAGSVNGEGALTVRVRRTGEATTLSQIRRLAEEAQVSRSRFQHLADRAAAALFFVALGAGVLTFGGWLLVGADLAFAVERTITVLVMACPHALGLAIPLVVVNATGLAARNGLLVRNREAFERARDIRVVAFDKTGTLTLGNHVVRGVVAAEGHDESAVLRIAAALEARSEHPLARAVVAEAARRGIEVPPVGDFEVAAGQGVAGTVDGDRYEIGRPEWDGESGAALPALLKSALAAAESRGESAVVLRHGGHPLALVTFADEVRASAGHAVRALQQAGVTPVMITGDAEAVARTVAAELGIEHVYARVLPGDKADLVRRLKSGDGTVRRVAFVGDGLNDAPALLEADLGVAIGAGTNVAIESADVVLMDDDPMDVVRALRLSRATVRKMRQNLFWATSYNVVALPLAAGVASGVGLVLSPAVGAVFMSASTVIVAVNALLLRRTRLDAPAL